MEKNALRNNLNKDKEEKVWEKVSETIAKPTENGEGIQFSLDLSNPATQKRMDEIKGPIEEEFRLAFQNQTGKIDRDYQREKDRQEQIGEMLSRIAPTSSLTYSAMNLTQTGKLKREVYFQTGERYYNQLDDEYFSGISDDVLSQIMQLGARMGDQMNGDSESETEQIPPPPTLTEPSLSETLRQSMVDVCLLGFFAVAFTTLAFLKFFRSDI